MVQILSFPLSLNADTPFEFPKVTTQRRRSLKSASRISYWIWWEAATPLFHGTL